MTGIRSVDLGIFVASTEAAARAKQDPNQHRVASHLAAVNVERKNDQKRLRPEETQQSHLIKRHDEDEEQPGAYDDHGRRRESRDEDELPPEASHVDIVA